MNENLNVDFFDFIKLIAFSFPFLAAFYFIRKVIPSSEIAAVILISFSVYLIWCFHMILKKKGLGIGTWFRMKTFGNDLLWSIIVFPVVFGIYLLMVFLTSKIWSSDIMHPYFSLNTNPFLMVLALGLFFPVAEEVVFRGALYEYMEQKFSPEFSMVMVSTAFAVVHPLEDWMKMFVLGMLLNLLYYRRKTLTVPATLHVMVNLLYLSIMYLYTSKV